MVSVYSLLQRLRSLRHRFSYGVSESVRWSRGAYRETAACGLPDLPLEQAQRIAALKSRYQVCFEAGLCAATSVRNYEYLGILDEAWAGAGLARPEGGSLCDVGCASFWYAAALHAFFRPRSLVGVEVEGHRLFKDARTRIDYAAGYVAPLPNTRFAVADYLTFREPADVITAWFPFVTPAAILAWRLPLSLLAPERLLRRVCDNLNPGGLFLMVNHGPEEADLAGGLCVAAGLAGGWRGTASCGLSRYREATPVVSCWMRVRV
jgi:SAM-dependent methyltransferase